MIRVADSIEVEQAPGAVFAFLSDVGNFPKFQAEVVQTRVLSSGPMTAGMRFEEVVKVGPWRVNARCLVTAYDPAGTFAFRAESAPVHYEVPRAIRAGRVT